MRATLSSTFDFSDEPFLCESMSMNVETRLGDWEMRLLAVITTHELIITLVRYLLKSNKTETHHEKLQAYLNQELHYRNDKNFEYHILKYVLAPGDRVDDNQYNIHKRRFKFNVLTYRYFMCAISKQSLFILETDKNRIKQYLHAIRNRIYTSIM